MARTFYLQNRSRRTNTPLGDHFTMGPREAAYAAQLLNVPAILPIHYGTFPLLTGTPEELCQLTASQDVEIISLAVGGTLTV